MVLSYSIAVNFQKSNAANHVLSYIPTLWMYLINNPLYWPLYTVLLKVTPLFIVQVRPYNAEKTTNMRTLNPTDIDQLITISGMVIRSSNIIPEMTEGLLARTVKWWCLAIFASSLFRPVNLQKTDFFIKWSGSSIRINKFLNLTVSLSLFN